jgi:hypothetical protein
MVFHRRFESSEVSVPTAAITAEARSMAPGTEVSPSLGDRVAAIRAKAAGASAVRLQDAATAPVERPAQVAWNDWKNE